MQADEKGELTVELKAEPERFGFRPAGKSRKKTVTLKGLEPFQYVELTVKKGGA